MRDSDWSRANLLRSDWLPITGAIMTTTTKYKVTFASNVSVKSKLQHPHPPGIPRAFDAFAVPRRREFDYQCLPGAGEFDPHS